MIDYNLLLSNPELAKNVKFEISGENLLEIASVLAKSLQPKAENDEWMTRDEVKALTGRSDNSTLWRWNEKGVLKHNQLGLYKKSDVIRFLNKV